MYQSLLKKSTSKTKHVEEIEYDVQRSLPEHVSFSRANSPGVAALKRLLIAYRFGSLFCLQTQGHHVFPPPSNSHRNPKIGYCQGLGMIAGCLLLNMEEVDAYWMLCSLIENFLPPDYFTQGLAGLMIDLKVLDDLVTIRLPELKAHFTSCYFDLSVVAMNWMMTIFVASCPLEVPPSQENSCSTGFQLHLSLRRPIGSGMCSSVREQRLSSASRLRCSSSTRQSS